MYRDMEKKKKNVKKNVSRRDRIIGWSRTEQVILLIEPVVENCTVIFIIGYSHR